MRRELQRRDTSSKKYSAQEVQEKADELEDRIESDDPHIIALAIVADVKVLISNDRRLHEDFKNRNLVGGRGIPDKKPFAPAA